MASPTSRCAILLSLLFADTAALRLGAGPIYLSLPRELLALNVIPAAVAEAESTAENWAALRECFPTEAEALAAVEKNPATLLPYGFDSENRAENIRGSYSVLQDVLESEAEVQEVLEQRDRRSESLEVQLRQVCCAQNARVHVSRSRALTCSCSCSSTRACVFTLGLLRGGTDGCGGERVCVCETYCQ